jgi:hypothetical protein
MCVRVQGRGLVHTSPTLDDVKMPFLSMLPISSAFVLPEHLQAMASNIIDSFTSFVVDVHGEGLGLIVATSNSKFCRWSWRQFLRHLSDGRRRSSRQSCHSVCAWSRLGRSIPRPDSSFYPHYSDTPTSASAQPTPSLGSGSMRTSPLNTPIGPLLRVTFEVRTLSGCLATRLLKPDSVHS